MKQYLTGPETARLRHRAMTVDDAAAHYALRSDPEVLRYTGEAAIGSVEEAREAIAAYPDFDTVGYGRWACVLKATGEVIGFCGLKYLDEFDEVDVGFRFLREYWGMGLATEACAATLAFGFEVIGLTRIIGLAMPANGASIRVMEKCGMKRDGMVVTEGVEAVRFVLER